MKKKILAGLLSAAAVLALSACGGGGGGGTVIVDPVPPVEETYLFLIDNGGFAAADVHYVCYNSFGDFIVDDYTRNDGAFLFEPGESCTFDLIGFNGTPGDELYIEDDLQYPKEGIPYTCIGGDIGRTFGDGSFDYVFNDSCTFEF